MKKTAIVLISVWLFVFLNFAFALGTFNMHHWSKNAISGYMTVLSLLCAVFLATHNSSKIN